MLRVLSRKAQKADLAVVAPQLGFSGAAISDFRAQQGSSTPQQATFSIINLESGGTLGQLGVLSSAAPVYGAGATGWLSVSIAQSTGVVTLTFNPTGLSSSNSLYEATVDFNGSLNSTGAQTYRVVCKIDAASPTIVLSRSTVGTTALVGQNPSNETITVTNATGVLGDLGTVSTSAVTYQSGAGWITSNNYAAGTVTIVYNTAGLATGVTVQASFTVDGTLDVNGPLTVTLIHTVGGATSATYEGATLPSGDQQITWDPATKTFGGTVMDTTQPTTGGTVRHCVDTNALHAAIAACVAGDRITLVAGTVYTGPFTLKAGLSNYVVIETQNMTGLPAAGTRAGPGDSGNMAIIQTAAPANETAIKGAVGASFWWLRGLYIRSNPSQPFNTNCLVDFAEPNTPPGSAAAMGQRMVMDRCLINESPAEHTKRLLRLNCKYGAVLDSYIVGAFHGTSNPDSQAIYNLYGMGPFKIINNSLSGASQSILSGGSAVPVAGMGLQNMEFRRNDCWKNTALKNTLQGGVTYNVKQIFEMKNSRKILVEGNVFRGCWTSGQQGYGIGFTNYDGGSTNILDDEYNQDIVFAYNRLYDVGAGFQFHMQNTQAGRQDRVVIDHLLVERFNNATTNGAGRLFQVTIAGAAPYQRIGTVTLQHVSADIPTASQFLYFGGTPSGDADHVTFRNNVNHHGSFGIHKSGGTVGILSYNSVTRTFTNNAILVGGNSTQYPGQLGTSVAPSSIWTNYPIATATDFVVPSTAPTYNNAGSDGQDPGADVATVLTKTAGCLTGVWP